MSAYYNEFDPFAAAWLRELIAGGHIADGVVDERSIADVQPADLAGFTRCHFFAGIGGWDYALQLAGWPDDVPVWTGSCPCQPFSAAGKRRGTADERHLWPELRRLIAECGPAIVFGEQVASKDGRAWLTGVRADLEALGYGVGAADLCAAGVGTPHIRQRLFWVADAASSRCDRALGRAEGQTRGEARLLVPCAHSTDGRMADAGRTHGEWRKGQQDARSNVSRQRHKTASDDQRGCATGGRMADADGGLAGDGHLQSGGQYRQQPQDGGAGGGLGNTDIAGSQGRRFGRNSYDEWVAWAASVAIPCADGKWRRVPANEAGEPEPALFPLAHGVPNRVGTLRGAGNAIVPQVAAAFIAAAMECA